MRQLWSVGLLGCQARFFFAGGAFKSLLTSRPPKDLDLWAPSAEDRAALVAAVSSTAAQLQPAQLESACQCPNWRCNLGPSHGGELLVLATGGITVRG